MHMNIQTPGLSMRMTCSKLSPGSTIDCSTMASCSSRFQSARSMR